jgi:MtN3 and saliva related transmembrane protein
LEVIAFLHKQFHCLSNKSFVGKCFAFTIYMNWTQVIGLFAGICTSTSLLPQLIKTLREKKADDISKAMLFILMTGVATWVVYGILRDDMPIIVTNSFSLLLNIWMIVLRIRYRH